MKLSVSQLIVFTLIFISSQKVLAQSEKNYVQQSEIAIKIAEAIWLPIYGEKIYTKMPFKAILVGDSVWHVFGTLPKSVKKLNSNGEEVIVITKGGVPHAFINRKDGKILNVYHTK